MPTMAECQAANAVYYPAIQVEATEMETNLYPEEGGRRLQEQSQALFKFGQGKNSEQRRQLAAQHGFNGYDQMVMHHYHELLSSSPIAQHDSASQRRLSEESSFAKESYSTCSYTDGNLCVYSPKQCVFAFRGSDDVWDWLSNSRGCVT